MKTWTSAKQPHPVLEKYAVKSNELKELKLWEENTEFVKKGASLKYVWLLKMYKYVIQMEKCIKSSVTVLYGI